MFSLKNGLLSVSQSVFDAQQVLETNTSEEIKSKTSKNEGCPHCDKLRSFFGKDGDSGLKNGDPKELNGTFMNGDVRPFETDEIPGTDVTDLKQEHEEEEKSPSLTASVSHSSIDFHDSASPVLRSKDIPDQYLDRFMSLSLYSGKELGEEISVIMERLKENDMSDKEIEKYLRERELDIKNGQTSKIYIEYDGETYETGLQLFTRTSRTLKGLRHIIQGIENSMLAKELGLKENDMLLMINSECVADKHHKHVVDSFTNALKSGKDIALVIFRDLPGKEKNIYLTVRGTVNILISRGAEPIEVVVVNQLSQKIDNRVIGLKRTSDVLGPIFIWQHEVMGESGQYSLSINRTRELHMDVTYATDQKSHWMIYEYDGDVYTFQNGFQDGNAHPHKIWLIRNKETNDFIAIDDRSKNVYLSRQGILPDKDDNMPVDDRMLVAHVPLENMFLFESLSIMDHFLCVDARDQHKVEISVTQDSHINRFAFQLMSVSEVTGTRGNLATITRLRELDLNCKEAACVPHLSGNTESSFEICEAKPLQCQFDGLSIVDNDDMPRLRERWPPVSKGKKEASVLNRPGMHRFIPPPESKAEKEGVAVEGQVRHLTDRFELSTPSTRASCAVEQGHVKIISATYS